jgi:ribosomal small subunit protein bTHX
MGKGDKKTRRGKLFQNSYGVTRPRKAKPTAKPVVVSKPVAVPPPVEVKKPKPAAVKKETKTNKAETA